MASITIRNLDDDVKVRLRVRAAGHHPSMEEEARHILREALELPAGLTHLAAAIRNRFLPYGGAELEAAAPRAGAGAACTAVRPVIVLAVRIGPLG